MKRLRVLNDLDEDALREVGHIGANHAANALSKMIGGTSSVELALASLSLITDLPKVVRDREALVTGVYIPITGEVEGITLIIFPQKSALLLTDLLLKREPGTAKVLDMMDESVLKEVGNILSGSCLTALSNFLEIHLIEHVPVLAQGMWGALMDNIAIQLGRRAEQALILGLNMAMEPGIDVEAFFFIFLTLEEARVLLRAIRARVGVE